MGVLHISGDFSTSTLYTFQSSHSKYQSAYLVSQLTLTLTILSTCRDNIFRTAYTIDLNCTHPNLQVNRRWWIVANDAASHRPGIGASFKYGVLFTLLFTFLLLYDLADLSSWIYFGCFPSTYYCYRCYLMENSYHGVSDRLRTPEDIGYIFNVTAKGYV